MRTLRVRTTQDQATNSTARRRLLKWSFILAALILITAAGAILLNPTTRSVGIVDQVDKPAFPFEVVWEEETSVGFVRAIIVIPKQHYSGANARLVFLWYSQNKPGKQSLDVKLFTNRDLALKGYFEPNLSKLNPYPWDAHYFRRGVPPGKMEEFYSYRPIRWFPFWRQLVTLKDDFGY